MGYELYREVKQYAPADLDTGELALLLILADEANEDSRECFPGMDELCAYMRMSADGIGKILKRLAAKDLEVRVVVDKDKTGRPVYARRGLRTTYRIPEFRSAALAGPESDQTAKGRTTVRPKTPDSPDHSTTKAGLSPDHSPPKAGPQSGPSPQFPQEEDSLLPSQRILRKAGLGLTEDEETSFIAYANTLGTTGHKGPKWWRKVESEGDLPGLVAAWRATQATTANARDSPTPPPVDHCGQCSPDRLVEDEDGNRTPCQTCHPNRRTHP